MLAKVIIIFVVFYLQSSVIRVDNKLGILEEPRIQ